MSHLSKINSIGAENVNSQHPANETEHASIPLTKSSEGQIENSKMDEPTSGSEASVESSNKVIQFPEKSTPTELASANQETPIITKPKDKVSFLTEEKKVKLEKCENLIRISVKSSKAMAKALRTISADDLYKGEYGTFAEYLRRKWSIAKSYAYDMISFDVICENLSAMADIGGIKIQLPENERQARPLKKLNNEEQLKAWQAALKKAGKDRVQVKHVKKAVEGLLVKPATPKPRVPAEADFSQWVTSRKSKLGGDTYLLDFEQPLTWDEEKADLYCKDAKAYLKFIDKVDVSSSLYAIALKKESPKSYIIVNGEANKCNEVNPNEKGELARMFCPHLEFFALAAGIYVEFKGSLYEAGDLTDSSEIIWTPVTDSVLLGIFEKYNEGETQPKKKAA